MSTVRNILNETNIEVNANVEYTKRIELPSDIKNEMGYYMITSGTIYFNNIPFYINGMTSDEQDIIISDGILHCRYEFETENNTPTYLILKYTFEPSEKNVVNNKLVFKKNDIEQSIEIPISSIVGTNKTDYSNIYIFNPDLSKLSVGGTYYDIEYSIDEKDIQDTQDIINPPINPI